MATLPPPPPPNSQTLSQPWVGVGSYPLPSCATGPCPLPHYGAGPCPFPPSASRPSPLSILTCRAGLGLGNFPIFSQGQAMPPSHHRTRLGPGHPFSPQGQVGAVNPYFLTPHWVGLGQSCPSSPSAHLDGALLCPSQVLDWDQQPDPSCGWTRHCPSSLPDEKVEHHCTTPSTERTKDHGALWTE